MHYNTELEILAKENPELDDLVLKIENLKNHEILENIFKEIQLIKEAEPFFQFKNIYVAYSWNTKLYAARAQELEDKYLMLFNPVFIKNLYNNYNKNQPIHNLLNRYIQTKRIKTFLENDGLTWILNRILFYHEHAHFIQFSMSKMNSILEFTNKEQEFNFENHVLEIDADTYASYSIASHVVSNLLPNGGDKINVREVAEMLVLVFASSFAFIISISKDISKFYTKKRLHPHPILRAFISSNSLFQYFEIFTKENITEYDLDESKFWEISIGLAQEIIEILYPNDINLKLKDIFSNQIDKIFEYNKELMKGLQKIEHSAVKHRNLKIRELKEKTSR